MRTVLIVDDSQPIAMILARHLSSAGYGVRLAHDGAAALVQLARHVPDCILLDLMLPVMTGVELLHRLREIPAYARVPIVLVSARVGEGRGHYIPERDAGYSVGKPFTREQVLAAVEAAMREPADCPGGVFAVA